MLLTIFRQFWEAMLLMKFLYSGASWTLDPLNFMKIKKISWFVDSLASNTMCFFRYSKTFISNKYKNLHLEMKLGKDLTSYLQISWSNLFKSLTAVVQHHRLRWCQARPPSKIALLTLKLSIMHLSIRGS